MKERNGAEEIRSVKIFSGFAMDEKEEPKIIIENIGKTITVEVNSQKICMNDFIFLEMVALWLNQPREYLYGQPLAPTYYARNPAIPEQQVTG